MPRPAAKKKPETEKPKVPALRTDEYLIEISALAENMDPQLTLPEAMFNAMLELCVTAAHERRCESEWFLNFMRDCFKARSLVAELRAETAIVNRMTLPLTEEQRETLKAAADLTNRELVVLRGHIQDKLKLMAEMRPSPSTPIS